MPEKKKTARGSMRPIERRGVVRRAAGVGADTFKAAARVPRWLAERVSDPIYRNVLAETAAGLEASGGALDDISYGFDPIRGPIANPVVDRAQLVNTAAALMPAARVARVLPAATRDAARDFAGAVSPAYMAAPKRAAKPSPLSRERAEAIIATTRQNKGSSTHAVSGQPPGGGLMMGRYANTDPRNRVLDRLDALTSEELESFARTNAAALQRPENYLGTWLDESSGKVYLDVSRRFPPGERRQATKFGERTAQLSGYDVDAGDTFPVGSWRNFIAGDEFQQRMREMEQTGRNYLAQHPAEEWWDLHGSAFERVYGRENLPQVAGFTAATAPNAAPRENLQTMSEYMRRHIKGEPVIQPEWRVPPGQMTRQEGKKIGMEEVRKRNLEHAARGDLDKLQADKVREEAKALMGDPNAVVLDRHWARLAEDPQRGIYTAAQEGVVEPGEQYQLLKEQVVRGAQAAGRDPRDFSADVWTGIRETIRQRSELYGTKFRKGSVSGESKSYADQFEDLIRDKAKHLGISVSEMEARLRAGDATLLSLMLASPMLRQLLNELQQQQAQPDRPAA